MAKCRLSPQEFIKSAFMPRIAVSCSIYVDQICQKNNLSFPELLQPFCKLSGDACFEDVNGTVTPLGNLRISLIDVNCKPPEPTIACKLLNTTVSEAPEPRNEMIQIGDYNLECPTFAPWFESWRDLFLKVQVPSDHEFTKHFLGCLLVVSSTDPNPIEAMNGLNQTLNNSQTIVPNYLTKWFVPNAVRYYVILHDNIEGDINKATQTFEAFKVSYGVGKCFLLRMNSRPPGQTTAQLPDPWSQYICNYARTMLTYVRPSPDVSPSVSQSAIQSPEGASGNTLPYHPLSPDTEVQKLPEEPKSEDHPVTPNVVHGVCLTTDDVEQIKFLMYEFCHKSLLPFVEEQIHSFADIVSNKKGVSKSLLSATKRWFTPNKAGTSSGSYSSPMYPPDALEVQMRKLGDLYFMFGNYSMAYQVYHAVKREFHSDSAWLYYAGALEMASLAAFMANEATRKACDYMEEGIVKYLNVCKMPKFATRATLLSAECLKDKNFHGEAAHQLIRMTSEDSDLRSALFLEQAAYCFLNCAHPQMVRKYAFHMVLAGHRFSKALQKTHALRCYKQALQVYRQKGWTFSEDHVHYTIGKLASNLNILGEAASSFSSLLKEQSKQPIEQQMLFLREYLAIEKLMQVFGQATGTPNLLLPVLETECLKILVGPTPPLSIPRKVPASGMSFNNIEETSVQKWTKLEEMVVQEAQGILPLTFKPAVTLYTKDNFNNVKLIAVVKESIQISITLCNPLAITLYMKNIHLWWDFKDSSDNVITNEHNDKKAKQFVQTHITKSVIVQGNDVQESVVVVTPLVVGTLLLKGIFYDCLSCEHREEAYLVRGKQLFELQKILMRKKNVDRSAGLPISILPPAPCLQVSFNEINTDVLSDELQQILMEMRNVGSGPLHKVYLSTSVPHLLSMCEFNDKYSTLTSIENVDTPALREKEGRKNHVTFVPLPNDYLDVGQSYSVNLWIKAPSCKGSVSVDLLIYYENCSDTGIPRYRLIRHVWNLTVHDSLEINLAVAESYKSKKKKEVLFAVKAVNLNKLHYSTVIEILLLSSGFLSQMWKLDFLENVKIHKPLPIPSQQSAYILLKGRRRLSKTMKYYGLCLTSTSNCATNSNKAFVDFAIRKKQNRINIFDDSSTGLTGDECEGVLFFNWSAVISDNSGNKRNAIGQSTVRVERMKIEEDDSSCDASTITQGSKQCPVHNIPEEGVKEELYTQITSCITFKSSIYHDFQKRELCIVPVKLALHNDSHLTSVITINTLDTNSASPGYSLKPNLFQPLPSKEYRWVGVSDIKKTVKGFSSEIIMLYAAVSSPGVYDLGSQLEILCKNDLHDEFVLQILRPQYSLIVHNKD